MDDRRLLELAAKAAGIELTYRHGSDSYYYDDPETGREQWYPLGNDGQALRLAVKLEMNVFQAAKSAYALPSDDDGTYDEQVRYIDAGDDPLAATRRAIVRAAAAIGGA